MGRSTSPWDNSLSGYVLGGIVLCVMRVILVVYLLLYGRFPCSDLALNIYKDISHLSVAVLFGFWRYGTMCQACSVHCYAFDPKFYRRWFWIMCAVEIVSAALTVYAKKVLYPHLFPE